MKAYVAYGSNLDLHQMYRRCPTSELWRTGYIEGYELNFKKMPMGRAAFATIDKKKGARVPVGVFRINRFDEKMLDLYEGYPRHYKKKTVSVALDGGWKHRSYGLYHEPVGKARNAEQELSRYHRERIRGLRT